MGCSLRDYDAAELAVGYAAGTLDTDTRLQFQSHIRECVRCRELTEAQKQLWDSLESWTPIEVSADFNRRLLRRVAVEKPVPAWRSVTAWFWRPAIPLTAASIALFAALWMRQPDDRLPPSAPQQHGAAIEQVERALDDIEMLKTMGVAVMVSPETPSQKM